MAKKAQPRGKFRSVNEILFDEDVRRSVWIDKLTLREQRQIVLFLEEELIPDLLRKIRSLEDLVSRGQETAVQRLKTLQNTLKDARRITQGAMRKAYDRTKGRLESFAEDEASWQVKTLRSTATPFGVEFGAPAVGLVRAIVASKPMHGKQLKEWFKDISRVASSQVERSVRIGMAEGESISNIVKRVRSSLDLTKRQATTIVRTAVNHVANYANELVYQENEEVIKGIQYVAVLDTRTSEICRELDGKVFPINEGPRPPQHPNCRSRTVPVLKSWEELGIDLDEAPEGTRVSMSGQVPASMTYNEWLRRQSASIQDEVLGRRKGLLFRKQKSKHRLN